MASDKRRSIFGPPYCWFLGHKWKPSTLSDWMEDRTNFVCEREGCDARAKRAEDAE